MPVVVFHRNGQAYREEVAENTNLVVRAGIRRFPYPHFSYGCGMGKCGRCVSRILSGAEHLPPPNWKEQQQLGDKLAEGWRLACQLWLNHDVELEQEGPLRFPGAKSTQAG